MACIVLYLRTFDSIVVFLHPVNSAFSINLRVKLIQIIGIILLSSVWLHLEYLLSGDSHAYLAYEIYENKRVHAVIELSPSI